MKTKIFTILFVFAVSVGTMSAEVLFRETFVTRRGSTDIDKVQGITNTAWPYASQWFTGYTGTKGAVTGNQYDNAYTNVASYTVSIRGKKINEESTNTVGLYFGASKVAAQNYVKFDGGALPEIPVTGKYFLYLEICSPEEDSSNLSTMVVQVNDETLEVPATQLGNRLETSVTKIALTAGQINSLYIAFNNAPSQKFINLIVIGDSMDGTVIPTTFAISTAVNNPELGSVSGGGIYNKCPRDVTVTATPANLCHFVQWADGNTDNPRTINLAQDTTLTAIFAKNPVITYKYDSIQGHIEGEIATPTGVAEGNITFTAYSNYGFHFAQWNDGNTENPRTIYLTHDTTFTAEFAFDRTGKCGNNLALTWTYNPDKKVLTIEGDGAFVENIQCGVEARSILEKVIIGKGVTAMNSAAFTGCPNLTAVEWNATDGGDCTACPFPTTVNSVIINNGVEHIPAYLCYGLTGITSIVIPSSVKSIGDYAFANINSRKINNLVLPSEIISIGDYAFAGNTYIEQIDFGKSLEFIGAYAFQGCSRVMTMTCLAEMTPDVGTDGLASISSNADLYVLSSALKKYQVDPNWSRFLLKELGAKEETTSNQVIVEPGDNLAIFIWPVNNNAASYTIQITKDGDLICTLVFNENGQLIGIAFAPSRDGTATAPAATLSVAGMSFTVTGLNSASKYGYSLTAADDNNNELVTYRGEFATTGYEGEVNPGGEPEPGTVTAIDNVNTVQLSGSTKFFRDGQLFIERNGKTYNAQGARVR